MVLEPEVMVPAAGQGIVGVTCREEDTELLELLHAIEDAEARVVATAERALLGSLDGSCRTPIGAHARLLPGGTVRLTGLVARPDGSFVLKRTVGGGAKDAGRLGHELGEELRRGSPADVLV
jgi:hydroxymethylbilane synthase